MTYKPNFYRQRISDLGLTVSRIANQAGTSVYRIDVTNFIDGKIERVSKKSRRKIRIAFDALNITGGIARRRERNRKLFYKFHHVKPREEVAVA